MVTLTVIQIVNCALAAAGHRVGRAARLSRSRFGRSWRAVSDDPPAAAMCGVDVRSVFYAAVLGGALLAALAGSMAALYYGNISFGSGMVYGLKVLFVTAVGGYRDPARAAVGRGLLRHRGIAVVRLFPHRMARRLDVRVSGGAAGAHRRRSGQIARSRKSDLTALHRID